MKKLIIIHPGIHHAFRLANAAVESKLFESVYLLTGIILRKPIWWALGKIKNRIKNVNEKVVIKNHMIYELLSQLNMRIANTIPWVRERSMTLMCLQQIIFGMLCIPFLYLHRKNSILVCYETAGWPLTWVAQKFKIPVIMDFASISHESAEELGIAQTAFEKKIKTIERNQIDFAFFCSNFSAQTYNGKTSAKKSFVIHLGMEPLSAHLNYQNKFSDSDSICISFIGNTPERKGLDILYDAILSIKNNIQIELILIGSIPDNWGKIAELSANGIKIKIIPTMNQQELFSFLSKAKIDLNIQPSRFDSFCMVVPETMAFGITNILSPYVGVGELLMHRNDVLIMDELNAESVVREIDYWLSLTSDQKKLFCTRVVNKAREISWGNYNSGVSLNFTTILNCIY